MSHHVMPIHEMNGRFQIACPDQFDWQRWDVLIHMLNHPLDKALCPCATIDRLLKNHYGIGADTVALLRVDQAVGPVTTTDLSEEEAANEPTVVNLVNRNLSEAIRSDATDIHFEPYEGKYRVRYRIDAMLEDMSIPISVHLLKLALVSRIKIMITLDTTEKRLPQNERCQGSLMGHDYNLRVSILPGVYGEAVVIHLQSRQMVELDLRALGYESQEQTFAKL